MYWCATANPDPVLTEFRKHIDQCERRLTLQLSSEFEGHISYQAGPLPSQVGMCGLGEPVASVLARERALQNFKSS